MYSIQFTTGLYYPKFYTKFCENIHIFGDEYFHFYYDGNDRKWSVDNSGPWWCGAGFNCISNKEIDYNLIFTI